MQNVRRFTSFFFLDTQIQKLRMSLILYFWIVKSKNCECTRPVTIQSALSNVPVSKVTILKPVTASNSLVDQSKPNKAPISRVTFLKPVSRLSSSVELNRPNEVTSSASHNSITDQADKMQNERRGLDKSNRNNGIFIIIFQLFCILFIHNSTRKISDLIYLYYCA